MPTRYFPDHTVESAPAAARRNLAATADRLGFLPVGLARQGTSPHLLDAFLKISGLFESTTLDPLSREVLIMTIAARNGCHLCVAMHTAKLTKLGADPTLITALQEQQPLDDARLAAIQRFILAVLAMSGAVDDATMQEFLDHGYTAQNALEVVLGIGAYTMSTLANQLVQAPVDEQLKQFAQAG